MAMRITEPDFRIWLDRPAAGGTHSGAPSEEIRFGTTPPLLSVSCPFASFPRTVR